MTEGIDFPKSLIADAVKDDLEEVGKEELMEDLFEFVFVIFDIDLKGKLRAREWFDEIKDWIEYLGNSQFDKVVSCTREKVDQV